MAKKVEIDGNKLDSSKSFSFPKNCLPKLLVDFINSISKTRGLYKDHAYASAFQCLGACSGQSVVLQIKKGQIEKPSQYLMLVGNSGVNKSANISVFSKPIEDNDLEQYKRYEKLQKARSILQDKLTNNFKSSGTNSDVSLLVEKSRIETIEQLKQFDNITDITEEDLVQLGEDPNRMRDPKYIQTIIDDSTPESVIESHKIQPRGLFWVVDEVIGLFDRFDRYSKSNEAQKLMEMHSYKPVVVNRKGGKPVRINNICVNINGSIQPDVLEKFAKSKSNIKSGFLGRFDFVCTPKNYKRPQWIDEETDQSLVDSYYSACKTLLSIEMEDENNPFILTLNEDAREYLFAELNRRNKEWDKVTDEYKSALLGKFATKLHRYILTLHLINFAYSDKDILPSKVGIQTVKYGFQIMDFFQFQTTYVFDIMFDDDPLREVADKYRQLYDKVPNEFKPSEIKELAESLGIKQTTLYDHLYKNPNLYQKRGNKYIKFLDYDPDAI